MRLVLPLVTFVAWEEAENGKYKCIGYYVIVLYNYEAHAGQKSQKRATVREPIALFNWLSLLVHTCAVNVLSLNNLVFANYVSIVKNKNYAY